MAKKKMAINTILAIIVFNVGTKMLGFVRDAMISGTFGAEMETDAYFAGLNVTTLIFLSLGSAIATTSIPIIVKIKDSENKDKILSSILSYILVISMAIMTVYLLFTGTILNIATTGFTGEKLALSLQIIKILAPTVVFICIAYFFVGLLQANEHYLLPTLISVPYNLVAIIYLMFFADKFGIVGLAFITLFGWFLQMTVQLPTVVKVAKFKFRFTLTDYDGYAKMFLISLLPIVFVASTSQLNVIVDTGFISLFGDGSVSAFYYANMLFTALVTIIVYAITAVMFPKFNKKFTGDKEEFYASISKVIEGMILLLIPVSVCLISLSDEIISVIFLRGEFTTEDVRVTTQLLIGYSSFMVAFGIWDVINKGFFTINNKKIPMLTTLIIVCCNYIFTYACINIVDAGIVSVTYATSVAFYIGVGFALYMFATKYGKLDIKSILKTIKKTAVGVVVLAVVIYVLTVLINNNFVVDSNVKRFIVIVILGGSGVVSYLATLVALKEENIMGVVGQFTKGRGEK